MDAVVLAGVGGRYRVYYNGTTVEASLRGRVKQKPRGRVLVGDRVTLVVHPDESATIEEVQPRQSLLRRRRPGSAHGERTVAANVDQVVVVGSAADPAWDPALIDRFTAVAAANAFPVTVVVNKVDLVPDAERLALPYRAAGYTVLATSAKTRHGLETLGGRLAGRISLFTGPTGVGKSSLLNALFPGLQLRIGAVSARSRSGRHTTVAAEMHPVGGDGFVVDTPGLSDIGLWGLDREEVVAAFPEFAEPGAECRFDNCRHREEPGCAVRAAVETGTVAESRYLSYCRLLDEAERAARPWLT